MLVCIFYKVMQRQKKKLSMIKDNLKAKHV
jgi:hypothetical protein